MHRSLLSFLRQRTITCSFINLNESVRLCVRPQLGLCNPAISQSIHTSHQLSTNEDNDEKKDVKAKSRSSKKRRKEQLLPDNQLEIAAKEAAKSLPGDWTRTANDLMARLNHQGESSEEKAEEQQAEPQNSLLSTMKVGRSFERTRSRSEALHGIRPGMEDIVGEKQFVRKRLARKNEIFTSLYSQPRLGIFDAKKMKAATKSPTEEIESVSLWQTVAEEKKHKVRSPLPRNGFEEMIEWTKEGRMWTFPVDNEEGMVEEQEYKFHDHVFLGRHLKAFPSDGPIRRFMDLVVAGLSSNPWLTVPEKREHIEWYADYFLQKQQLLESSLGDKAKMKQ